MNQIKSVTFYKPSKTLSVSLTGGNCMLNCAHCGGHYLEHMIPIDNFLENISNYHSYKSVLLSGGCNSQGSVDFSANFEKLKVLVSHGFGLNFHTGLVDASKIELIKELASLSPLGTDFKVSFDFLTDDNTIRQVYGLDKTGIDYINSYKSLRQIVNVTPHICIGILGGKLKGELSALKELSKIGCDKVVLIIFIPTRNTTFENCLPPALDDIEHIFKVAKEIFPDIPIQLGCMRPSGKIRKEIDLLALSSGISHIVMPSKEAVSWAENMSLTISYKGECCVL